MGTAIAEGLLKLAALTLIWIVAIFCIPLVTKITTNKLTKFFIGLAIVVSLPAGIAFMLAWSKFENQLRESSNHKSVAQS
jgi:membrane protein CcdC involved in cytochrome C biogenesis